MTEHPTELHARPIRARSRLVLLMGVMVATLLAALWLGMMPEPPAQAAPVQVGPDLTVEIILDPPIPSVGQLTNIRYLVRNIGNASTVQPVTLHYYRPGDNRNLSPRVTQVPALPAGGSFAFDIEYTFNAASCDYFIYAFVDPNNQIVETNEQNNELDRQVCVGIECVQDAFDPSQQQNNNQCSAANWISDGDAQAHTFCNPVDRNQPDVDWVKFTAFQGLTYTLDTSNQGQFAQPQIALYSACNSFPLVDDRSTVVWQAPASGLYYARIINETPQSGPFTAYSLTLTSQTGVTDPYEPNNECTNAGDIPADGTKQTHLFQDPADVDWVKFTVRAGQSFALVTEELGQGINPLISLFTSCSQARGAAPAAVAQAPLRVEASAPEDQVYFARIVNQDPNRFGADASYTISVLAADCAGDEYEENDSFNQAKELLLDTPQRHNTCPPGDRDWAKMALSADTIYVIETTDLGPEGDTVLTLYNDQGQPLASNDDYGYVNASRIVFEPSVSGTYYVEARHADPTAAGEGTEYTLLLSTGFCVPDAADAAGGDNGPGDAATIPTDNTPQSRNFCADPTEPRVGDQDWARFDGQAGATYYVETGGLGNNADTVIEVFAGDGRTRIGWDDDSGQGRAAAFSFTAPADGEYFVRVTQFNSNVVGQQTEYQLRVREDIPPTPTPTPTPLPTATPTPTPTPQIDRGTVRTLILVNRQRLDSLYSPGEAQAVINKLFELAEHERVQGAVVQVESNPNVAAAYAAWTENEDADNDADNTLLDNDLANGVASAIRSQVLTFASNAPELRYVVIVGDDRVIPFRRVPEGTLILQEESYAGDVTPSSSIASALAQNQILTDDYYVNREPSFWRGNELFLPDYAIGRLVETPDEIMAFIDSFIANPVNDVSRVLVTGYDFVQDSASLFANLWRSDLPGGDAVIEDSLIGSAWPTEALRLLHLQADPRFDIHTINGHATHVRSGSPLDEPTDANSAAITAQDVLDAATNFSGALVYTVGCHAGLNVAGQLDLPQAFLSRGAHYVGNTGYGWGGGGIVYSEALMRNYTRELIRDTSAEIGPALAAAKQRYWSQAFTFRAYDAKVLMQSTLYGLPMAAVTTGGAFSDDDPFPSASTTFAPPSSFGSEANVGTFGYGLPGSFGSFGEESNEAGSFPTLDGNVFHDPGAPILPHFYADASAPAAGRLRGMIFRGGVFSDTVVAGVALAGVQNEYIQDAPDSFDQPGWYPAVPFNLQNARAAGSQPDIVSLALGQYNSGVDDFGGLEGRSSHEEEIQRLYDRMTFNTLYSNSDDEIPPQVRFVDGVLNSQTGQGEIKVEATDNLTVTLVVVAYTANLVANTGEWKSVDLIFDDETQKWTGTITATAQTRYFVQAADAAGNVTVNDNKGRYYRLLPPLPLAQGAGLDNNQSIFLPLINRD